MFGNTMASIHHQKSLGPSEDYITPYTSGMPYTAIYTTWERNTTGVQHIHIKLIEEGLHGGVCMERDRSSSTCVLTTI